MRKVFLEDLPKWGKGGKAKEGSINWAESVGHKVAFVYEDVEGEIEIVDFKDSYLKLKYNGVICDKCLYTASFVKCSLGYILNKINVNFKYEIGDTIKDKKRNMTIIDRKYIKRLHIDGKSVINSKKYKIKCNICGFTSEENYKKGEKNEEYWIGEDNIKRGGSCPCCCNPPQVVVTDINSMWKTDYWMVDIGIDEEFAKTHTSHNNGKTICKCPHCNKEKYCRVSDVNRHKSIGCTCNIGTYPEKFMFNILRQLGLEFQTQLSKTTLEWCGDKRYDFYVPSLNIIIETHGEQHYKYTGFKRTLQEEQENDRFKRESALTNGIENYIELDCRESDLEYIKNSILESKLKDILDLSTVNWKEADLYAIKSNRVKEVCDYWNNKEEWETTQTIAKNNKLGIKAPFVITTYLKKGTKLGWCQYDTKEEIKKCAIKCNKLKCKPIEVFKDGELLGVFESATELSRVSKELFGVKLGNGAISSTLNPNNSQGKYMKPYKGFTFKYANNNKGVAI